METRWQHMLACSLSCLIQVVIHCTHEEVSSVGQFQLFACPFQLFGCY